MKTGNVNAYMKIARRQADKERSDPFVFNRVMSHLLSGVTSEADYGGGE